jgi:hypothetical protein
MPGGALSRADAFQRHGVVLKFPALSRSGVRDDDGMVLFAMEGAKVRVDDWGCSCLLWSHARRAPDQAIELERLRHCRLALQLGMAEGFLVWDGGTLGHEALLALRVVKAGKEYWARWGYSVRTRQRQCAMGGSARA